MTDKQKEALDILIREYSSLNITKDEFYILTEFIIEEKQTYVPQPWMQPITTPYVATGLTGESISDAASTTEDEPIGHVWTCGMLNKSVKDIGLSVRTYNILLANDIITLADVCRLSKTDVLRFHNAGRKTLRELDNLLKDYGLNWGMNV